MKSFDKTELRDLAELIEAVRQNAIELTDEAKLLLTNRRVARAYALGHMACEEFGKLPILVGIAGRLLNGDTVNWPKTWKRFRDHDSKRDGSLGLFAVNAFLHSLEHEDSPLRRTLMALPDDIRKSRNLSLYVDRVEAGILQPRTMIAEMQAQAIIDVADYCSKVAHTMFGDSVDETERRISVIAKKWAQRKPPTPEQLKDGWAIAMIKERLAARDSLVGRVLSLTGAITNGVGVMSLGNDSWRVEGPDLPAGTQVRVIAADTGALKVEKAG